MKKVKSKTNSGRLIWVLTPDIRIARFLKRKQPISFLDIFYVFAPLLVKSKKQKEWAEGVKCTMIDLNNRVSGMDFIVKEMKKQESKLLKINGAHKNIYDYKPYQIFFVFTEAYLNCLHSICDLIKNIDKHLGKKYYADIWRNDWFKLNMDLRTLCHHIETPLIIVENGTVMFHFERSEKMNTIRFLSDSMKDNHGIIKIKLTCNDLGVDMKNFLDQWAKRHLNDININESIDQIKGFKKDGSFKIISIDLGTLIKIASSSANTRPKD